MQFNILDLMAKRRYVQRASDKLRSKAEDVSERMHDRFTDVEDHIHEMMEKKPMQTIAIAFGAGLIAGALVSQLMHRRGRE